MSQPSEAPSDSNEATHKSPLALPAPPTTSNDGVQKLQVGASEPVSLYDSMGPTVVAADGSKSGLYPSCEIA